MPVERNVYTSLFALVLMILVIILAVWISWKWFMEKAHTCSCDSCPKEHYFSRDVPVRAYDFELKPENVV